MRRFFYEKKQNEIFETTRKKKYCVEVTYNASTHFLWIILYNWLWYQLLEMCILFLIFNFYLSCAFLLGNIWILIQLSCDKILIKKSNKKFCICKRWPDDALFEIFIFLKNCRESNFMTHIGVLRESASIPNFLAAVRTSKRNDISDAFSVRKNVLQTNGMIWA